MTQAPGTAHAALAAPDRAASPGDTITMPVRDALQGLPVQDESRAAYERSKFRHWIDATGTAATGGAASDVGAQPAPSWVLPPVLLELRARRCRPPPAVRETAR